MRKLSLKISLVAALGVLCVAGVSQAATYHWTLVKRAHTTGFPNGATVNARGFAHAKGIAISAKTTARETFKVSWTEDCTRGSVLKVISGSFTSHGVGAKTPIKLGVANPDSCSVIVTAAPQQAGSFYLSVWRR